MDFKEELRRRGMGPLEATKVDLLQVNLGYRCNLSCKHCHLAAGPAREEIMNRATVDSVTAVLGREGIRVLDLTGGAPELNPHLRHLISEARRLDCHVIVRTNLTVLLQEGLKDLPAFYRDHSVEVIASLPYYLKESVDRVRGNGTFQESIEALRRLNAMGYADGVSGLTLNLVYNPQGMYLPPGQGDLEKHYRRELSKRFGIAFSRLFAFVNMPIGRFRDYLSRTNTLGQYLDMLRSAFNPQTVTKVMCRQLVSVGWNGTLYDCDFNQALSMPVLRDYPQTIHDFEVTKLAGRAIAVGEHCYGCTAGKGST